MAAALSVVPPSNALSFEGVLSFMKTVSEKRLDDAEVRALSADYVKAIALPSPPSFLDVAQAIVTLAKDSPAAAQSLVDSLSAPESPPVAPRPTVDLATAQWDLTPGKPYRVAVKPGNEDEPAPFDALTPVVYVRDAGGDYIVNDNGVDYPLSKQVFDLLPPYDTQSAWGRRRRRRTVRRRKTLRRKM